MKIQTIISQYRRDFTPIYECGHTEEGSGYDDAYLHQNVIPNKVCTVCNKKAPEDYRTLTTKYPENQIV